MVAGTITVMQVLPELESGGVERGTLEIGAYLTAQGQRSLVVSGGGRLVPQLEQQGSRHVCCPHIGEKSPRCLSYIMPMHRLMLDYKVDILHLRSRLPAWVAYIAWKLLPPERRPHLVTTFHGYYSINRYSAIMTKGERVIAISRGVVDHIQKHYGLSSQRIELIHRGYDENEFDPDRIPSARVEQLKKNWGLQQTGGPFIVLPGRFTRWKGHELFIRSLAIIRDLDWTALFYGETTENFNYVEELKILIHKMGMTERIHFVGYCSDMAAGLTVADLVVSASSGEAEAFGRVAVEAQALGKPVIATAHGGSLETVLDGKTGWLVRPGEVQEMAAGIRTALNSREQWQPMGMAGRRWVAQHFTTRRMCEKTLALYYALCGSQCRMSIDG